MTQDHPDESEQRTPLVLIVDDEPVILALIQATLGRDGRFDLVEGHDGEEAVALATELRPDAILLDVRMPRMSGLEACQALRADPRTSGATVIMLTAMGQDDDLERGYAAGADDYVLKPFAPPALLAKVQSALALQAAPAGGED